MRTIDADILATKKIMVLDPMNPDLRFTAVRISDVESAPTVNTDQRGEWIREPVEMGFSPDYRCSNCGKYAREDKNYEPILSLFCPDCGAKMMNLKRASSL